VTEIQKAVGIESNQKASALIRQLKEANLVVRSEVKGKAYFTLA
jgi:DNA-binding transcriptional regulator GbsR (MarR family)